jgi:acetyl-CoA carboxylase biotin carboxyl carrier protein
MDLRKLKTLIDLVSESNIAELEITENEGKVRIVKAGNATYAAPAQGQPIYAPQPAQPAPAPALTAAPIDTPPVAPVAAGQTVKSPMVGTFYSSSTPGGKAFVDVGSVVKEGEAICIIEAMKIMNEIEAELSGTITQVLVQNGQAVEFGQPLFVIE